MMSDAVFQAMAAMSAYNMMQGARPPRIHLAEDEEKDADEP